MATLGGRRQLRAEVTATAFPAQCKHASGIVGGHQTDVQCLGFTDKILVTISQKGRLAHWVHVSLENSDPNLLERRILQADDGSELLPMPHLTARTILGVRGTDIDILGQLYASQIATAIATKNPEENRVLVLGLGMMDMKAEPDSFLRVLDLVLGCI